MNTSVLDISKVSDRRETPATDVAVVGEVTPSQMLAIAVKRGADLATLEKFMDLQERWEKNQARKAFEAAVSAAKAEIKPIVKRQEVDFTSQKGRTHYKYEGFADIAAEIDPILAKHGLSYRHRSKQDGKRLTITCILAHRDGHSEETTLSADNDESGNKNSIQAIGSTSTFLQRYTVKLALGLSAAKDDDGKGGDGNRDTEPEPEGYEQWAMDMEGLASDGMDALQAAWKRSAPAFRKYAAGPDAAWWNGVKDQASRSGKPA